LYSHETTDQQFYSRPISAHNITNLASHAHEYMLFRTKITFTQPGPRTHHRKRIIR